MIEDELLKLRFRYGSRAALCRIYEKYLNYLLTLAMALLNDPGAAEDIVHDVFICFAGLAANFKLHGSLRSYLATAVVNRARDRFRKNLCSAVSLDDLDLPDTRLKDPCDSIVFSEEAQRLTQALTELPVEQREVVILRFKGGMRFRQIAKLQGVSVDTVQGRLRYGLTKLRSLLNGEIHNEIER
jgi:RNA polymerase sigma-70 factor, ECF subfamily